MNGEPVTSRVPIPANATIDIEGYAISVSVEAVPAAQMAPAAKPASSPKATAAPPPTATAHRGEFRTEGSAAASGSSTRRAGLPPVPPPLDLDSSPAAPAPQRAPAPPPPLDIPPPPPPPPLDPIPAPVCILGSIRWTRLRRPSSLPRQLGSLWLRKVLCRADRIRCVLGKMRIGRDQGQE